MAQTVQPISDDQELAKVLAGVTQQADDASPQATQDPQAVPVNLPAVDTPIQEMPVPTEKVAPVAPEPSPTPALGGDLESIKKGALNDLRPLVDKLDVSPEEKFDTYLLLLRSTDDQALIPQAYEAARNIGDEARKAQALLDIIKEIDYLAGPK